MFRRPLIFDFCLFRCSGVPKTRKNQILDFLYSLSWCSDVAFLIVGYRSGAPLVFQRPLNFPFQIFFSGSVRCSGVLKTPRFQTSVNEFCLFLLGVRPTELGGSNDNSFQARLTTDRNVEDVCEAREREGQGNQDQGQAWDFLAHTDFVAVFIVCPSFDCC